MNKSLIAVFSITVAVAAAILIFTGGFFQKEKPLNLSKTLEKEEEVLDVDENSKPEINLARNKETEDKTDLEVPDDYLNQVSESDVNISSETIVQDEILNDWTHFKRDQLYVFMYDAIEKYPSISITEIKCEPDSCIIEYLAVDEFTNVTGSLITDYQKKYTNDSADLLSMQTTSDGMKVNVEVKKKGGLTLLVTELRINQEQPILLT